MVARGRGSAGDVVVLPPYVPGDGLAHVDPAWRTYAYLVEDHARWHSTRSWSTLEAALLDVRPASGGEAVVGVGSPSVLAGWLGALLDVPDGPRPTRGSVPRGTWRALPPPASAAYGLERISEWDWLVCDRPPGEPGPGERHVRPLRSPEDRDAARALLAEANPATPTTPDDPGTRWWGWVDDDGRLRGVVGARRPAPDGPMHLGGIATEAAWRGRGIASAMTAAVVRESLGTAPWVSLGVRVGNDRARRVYSRLGFHSVGSFETVRAPAGPPR